MRSNARLRASPASRSRKFCAKIAPTLKFAKFRKSGTPRAQKIGCTRPSCAAHTAQRCWELAESALHSDSKKESARRRLSANFAPNSREENAEFQKNVGAPRSQKLRELAQRCCANRRTSLQLLFESVCVLMQDNARVQRRDHANFAQKAGENFKFSQNFRKSGTPRAQI